MERKLTKQEKRDRKRKLPERIMQRWLDLGLTISELQEARLISAWIEFPGLIVFPVSNHVLAPRLQENCVDLDPRINVGQDARVPDPG